MEFQGEAVLTRLSADLVWLRLGPCEASCIRPPQQQPCSAASPRPQQPRFKCLFLESWLGRRSEYCAGKFHLLVLDVTIRLTFSNLVERGKLPFFVRYQNIDLLLPVQYVCFKTPTRIENILRDCHEHRHLGEFLVPGLHSQPRLSKCRVCAVQS